MSVIWVDWALRLYPFEMMSIVFQENPLQDFPGKEYYDAFCNPDQIKCFPFERHVAKCGDCKPVPSPFPNTYCECTYCDEYCSLGYMEPIGFQFPTGIDIAIIDFGTIPPELQPFISQMLSGRFLFSQYSLQVWNYLEYYGRHQSAEANISRDIRLRVSNLDTYKKPKGQRVIPWIYVTGQANENTRVAGYFYLEEFLPYSCCQLRDGTNLPSRYRKIFINLVPFECYAILYFTSWGYLWGGVVKLRISYVF